MRARVVGGLGYGVARIVRGDAVMRRRILADDIGLALDAEIELQSELGGALDLPGQRRARAHRVGLFVIGELARDDGDVRPPGKLHHGGGIWDDGQLIVVRSLAEAVQGGAGEQLRAAHHPVEMIDRHGLGLGDAVHVDIERHAIFHALLHETSHRLRWVLRMSGRGFDLRSARYLIHGRPISLQACNRPGDRQHWATIPPFCLAPFPRRLRPESKRRPDRSHSGRL